jgi:PHD/YefM family antitoxin component YafN of YafNO toxin-antitoxin module
MLQTTATQLQENLQQEIKRCIEDHEVLHVNQEDNEDFVIMSGSDWRAIEETLFLNQIPNMVESIHRAATESLDKGVRLEDLDW